MCVYALPRFYFMSNSFAQQATKTASKTVVAWRYNSCSDKICFHSFETPSRRPPPPLQRRIDCSLLSTVHGNIEQTEQMNALGLFLCWPLPCHSHSNSFSSALYIIKSSTQRLYTNVYHHHQQQQQHTITGLIIDSAAFQLIKKCVCVVAYTQYNALHIYNII